MSRNKTCHRDRIARLTAPCHSHKKNFNVKLFANADAAANANPGASTIALPGLRPGKLKIKISAIAKDLSVRFFLPAQLSFIVLRITGVNFSAFTALYRLQARKRNLCN